VTAVDDTTRALPEPGAQGAARMAEVFDLYSPEIDADPFPAYERLREQYPCYWSDSGKFWILSRYEDVFNAAQQWETYSSAQGNLIDETRRGTIGYGR
jgi:cytochrome P450